MGYLKLTYLHNRQDSFFWREIIHELQRYEKEFPKRKSKFQFLNFNSNYTYKIISTKKSFMQNKGFVLVYNLLPTYTKVALEVITVSKSFEIGQFFSAFITSSWNLSSEMSLIFASTIK